MSSANDPFSGTPDADSPGIMDAGTDLLGAAIDRATHALWSARRADGSWDERSDIGPAGTANVLVSLNHVGVLPSRDLTAGASWLRAHQRLDGSFVPYPFAPDGSLSATAQCWAALHLDGASAGAARKAEDYVRSHGGIPQLLANMGSGDLAPIYLALAGLLDPRRLPCPPIVWALSDPVVSFASRRVHFGIVIGALQLSLIVRSLRGRRATGLILRRAYQRAVERMTQFQNSDGSWNSNTVQTALAVPALVAAVGIGDSRVRRAVDWLLSRRIEDQSGVWFDVFSSDLWTTAFNVRALLLAGISRADPRIVESIDWILDRQLETPQPSPNNRRRGAPRTGGWPFQSGNETMADCDDAGIVLSVLALALESGRDGRTLPPSQATRIRSAVAKARAWLDGMQNPDGGWPAFVWSVPGTRPQRTLFSELPRFELNRPVAALKAVLRPAPELGDPSAEDLTARVLHGLGSFGRTTADTEVARAVMFLRKHQTDFGAWWGRWVCNYLASTAYVLSGLASVREDLVESHVTRAIRFTLSRQNPDGGFGEAVDSYLDIARAGTGTSTVPLTALVAGALVEAGRGNDPAVLRAIAYLIREQRPDGTWPNGDYLAPNVPPDSFYFYGGTARHAPLEALARFAQRDTVTTNDPAEQQGRWTSAVLEPMRQRTDPVADDVVASIYASGRLDEVNRLLTTILRNDDPIPPGLPEVARRYFDATASLPTWADREKMARAEQVFAQHGLKITFGLFCSSLPQVYCAANGAPVLAQTGAMLNRVRQRIFETAQFLFDAMDRGALHVGGRGIRSAQRVRLMHAAIRHLVRHHPSFAFDAAVLGQPINQEDLAATLLTFSVVTFDAARKMEAPLTAADGDAWVHHWAAVGHVLGIEDDVLPRNLTDAEQLLAAFRERQWAPSPTGKQLAAALVDTMQELFTREIDHLDGLTPTLIRHLAGDRCGDLLGLPPADKTRVFIGAVRAGRQIFRVKDRDHRLERHLGELAVDAMRWITYLERGDKNAPFRVPQSLRESVTADRWRPWRR
jgi:squalene cyclase